MSELDVAIVGMSARLPGAPDVRAFWKNLVEARCSLEPLGEAELEEAGVDPAELRQPHYVRVGGRLQGFDSFDHEFFGISARDARLMDPQHRLLLELGWQAFEDAGYDISNFPGRVGVYAGVGMGTYLTHALLGSPDVDLGRDGQAIILGNAADYAATRLSYLFNLRGPSVTLQTACSTALVAIHEACQGLLSFQADMALAGACSVTLPHPRGYLFHRDSFFSPDGQVRAFDARAAGTVFTSGIALVVLKRRADAERDGDLIHAIIKGSAVNNDGSDKVGYVAPGVSGQSRVIKDALEISGVSPDSIELVEAHGTGTELGDPIELRALAESYRTPARAERRCAVGSVKTNVGHTDVAAGAVGLIKAALALEHRVLPASLGFESPNPLLELERGPFFVNQRTVPWETTRDRRRAAVSSFGIGGTNAHVILEEADARAPRPRGREAYCLTLSARTPESLRALVADYQAYLAADVRHDWADICFTSNVGRRALQHRHAIVAEDLGAARQRLERAPVPEAPARERALVVEDADLCSLLRAAGVDARATGGAADCRLVTAGGSAWLEEPGGARLEVGGSRPGSLAPAVAGHAWRLGVAVDWERFHSGERRWRVPLPTYAFARRRHWVARGGAGPGVPRASNEKNPDIGQWFYRPVWEETAPPIRSGSGLEGEVVLLVTRQAPGPALLEALSGARVVQVTPGGAFERAGPDRYAVAVDDERSCAQLAAALSESGAIPRYLIHALLVGGEPWAVDGSGFARAQALGLNSMVLLLRQLAPRLPEDRRLSVAVAASELAGALGERSNPDKATVIGATRTVPSEYPAIDCRIVDVAPSELEGDVRAARLLVSELLAKVAPENEIVAVRGGRRWHQTFARVQVPEACPSPVSARGAYVILGGLGELGLNLSRYLAGRERCHLVLAGSSRFVPRPEWDAWVAAHGPDHAYSKKIAALREIEARAASVSIVQCDVSDRPRLYELLDGAAAAHGALNAVIHAAGIVENGMVAHKDVARFADVFRAKVHGAYHLLSYAAERQGLKVVLCSSMNALVGGLGQIDNTASNAFVDAMACTELARAAGDVCSINWGAINSARLAEPVVLPQFADLSREHKKNHMTEAEIHQVYDRILSWSFGPRLVVSTIDLKVVLQRWGEVSRVTELARLRRVATSLGEAKQAQGAPREYRSRLHRFVVEAWSGILGVEDLQWDDDLFARGAHSLGAVQFSSMLKDEFGLRLHAMGLYEFPRLGALVEYLQKLLDEQEAKAALGGRAREGGAG